MLWLPGIYYPSLILGMLALMSAIVPSIWKSEDSKKYRLSIILFAFCTFLFQCILLTNQHRDDLKKVDESLAESVKRESQYKHLLSRQDSILNNATTLLKTTHMMLVKSDSLRVAQAEVYSHVDKIVHPLAQLQVDTWCEVQMNDSSVRPLKKYADIWAGKIDSGLTVPLFIMNNLNYKSIKKSDPIKVARIDQNVGEFCNYNSRDIFQIERMFNLSGIEFLFVPNDISDIKNIKPNTPVMGFHVGANTHTYSQLNIEFASNTFEMYENFGNVPHDPNKYPSYQALGFNDIKSSAIIVFFRPEFFINQMKITEVGGTGQSYTFHFKKSEIRSYIVNDPYRIGPYRQYYFLHKIQISDKR